MTAPRLAPLTGEQRAMVEANLGLVGHTIKIYYPQLVGDPDAWQDGVIGLARATRDYRPDQAKFSTYATPWIRSEIGNGLGRLNGINARAANYRRAAYQPPMSLDAQLGSDGDAPGLLGLLADPDSDPTDTACHRATLTELARVLDRAVVDDLDRDLARRLIARTLDHHADTRAEIAARHDVADSVVQYRARRLVNLLRSHLLMEAS